MMDCAYVDTNTFDIRHNDDKIEASSIAQVKFSLVFCEWKKKNVIFRTDA